MGNSCNPEEHPQKENIRQIMKNSYHNRLTNKNVNIEQALNNNQDLIQKQMEIGPYLDKEIQDSNIWQKEFSGEGQSVSLDDLQKALYLFHRTNQNRYLQLLIKEGGGKIRWFVWKAVLRSLIPEKTNAMQLRPTEIKQEIIKDVQRTFPQLKYFINKEGVENLTQLLNLSCTTFKQLGYTQGMNFVIAFILMITGGSLKEAWEATFILFYSDRFLLYGMFIDQFPLQQVLCSYTLQLLKILDPILHTKYEQLKIDPSLLLSKWLLTLYLYNNQIQTSLRFWDLIIARGIFITAFINVQILLQFKDNILKCKDSCQFLNLVQNQSIDVELIIKRAIDFNINYKDIKTIVESLIPYNTDVSLEFLIALRKCNKSEFRQEYQNFIQNKLLF